MIVKTDSRGRVTVGNFVRRTGAEPASHYRLTLSAATITLTPIPETDDIYE